MNKTSPIIGTFCLHRVLVYRVVETGGVEIEEQRMIRNYRKELCRLIFLMTHLLLGYCVLLSARENQQFSMMVVPISPNTEPQHYTAH